MWLDKTVDYISATYTYIIHAPRQRHWCGALTRSVGRVALLGCSRPDIHFSNGFICQIPDARHRQNKQPLIPSPLLRRINVTTAGHNWWPVICRQGHVTHSFLTCDVAAFCWAEGRVTISLSPDSWALPTSQSCPAELTSLPPLFLCRSEEQHVPYTLACDHRHDCLDGSDEHFCKYLPCELEHHFQCPDKQVSGTSLYLYREPAQ